MNDELIYIVNSKQVSESELKKIDKNKIVTIDIKGPEKGQNKSAMVIQLKSASVNGDTSVIKQNNAKEKVTWGEWVEAEKQKAEADKQKVEAKKQKAEAQKQKEGTIVVEGRPLLPEEGSKKPLIVLDGKIMVAGFDMNSIKPTDIASVSILKDESATAIYGEKAKNGVVQITLKKKN